MGVVLFTSGLVFLAYGELAWSFFTYGWNSARFFFGFVLFRPFPDFSGFSQILSGMLPICLFLLSRPIGNPPNEPSLKITSQLASLVTEGEGNQNRESACGSGHGCNGMCITSTSSQIAPFESREVRVARLHLQFLGLLYHHRHFSAKWACTSFLSILLSWALWTFPMGLSL